MRNLYRIFLILVLLLIFMAAFLFVTANTQPVTLAVPVADWQYQVTLGALVVVLLAYHVACWRILLNFRADNNTRSHVFYRWFNELPVFILLAVVILAVVKPF